MAWDAIGRGVGTWWAAVCGDVMDHGAGDVTGGEWDVIGQSKGRDWARHLPCLGWDVIGHVDVKDHAAGRRGT